MTASAPLLPWQQHHWQQLQLYLQQQRIPQALLIIGAAGLGKRQLAEQFAAALLCTRRNADGTACGHCRDCRLINANTHPDLMTLAPAEDKTAIGVDQIRNLITQINLKPQFDGYRVVLINPADSMNINAANAFLKCLEEPTERTLFLLITDKPGKLPATIISRCQKLALSIPKEELACAWLQQQSQLKANDPKILLRLAQGAPLRALGYADNENLTLSNECFKTWLALAKQQAQPVIVAENWHKLPEAMLLNWLGLWLVDLLKCCFQAEADSLYNPSLHPALRQLAEGLDPKKIYKLYDLLLTNQQRLHTTINKQLMFEELLIQWAQLNQGTKGK